MKESILQFFEQIDPVTGALIATTFTWLVTAAGAGLVFFFNTMKRSVLDGMLGFTGGVMIAARFWSLPSPAIDMTPGEGLMNAIPATAGFANGALLLLAPQKLLRLETTVAADE